MSFRCVDKSTFSFETDLPPSSRNIHPSGVLHAFRTTTSNGRSRQEHAFAWIENTLHVEPALAHLETHGFDRTEGIAFIPYSTKRNWLDSYPHAAPALDCGGDGTVTVALNHRPYPNGLGELGRDDEASKGKGGEGGKHKKRKHKSVNLLQDNAFLPDAERDELHVEMYNYLAWLHGKLGELEGRAAAAGDDEAAAAAKKGEAAAKMKKDKGIDTAAIKGVLRQLEKAFAIIPNVKEEMEVASQDAEGNPFDAETKEGGKSEGAKAKTAPKGAPFLEEALGGALTQLVAARELGRGGNPKRRSQKKQRTKTNNPNRMHDRTATDFDEMYQRLVRYKEQHGDTLVSKSYAEDPKLANWVRGIREKKGALTRKGVEVEVIPKGGKVLAKSLTAERQEKLNAIGFVWSIAGPKVSWNARFDELMAYKNEHGKWPSQSMGAIGEWVHKQRGFYQRKDANYMMHRAPKLDAVGFEWTPRGNTRMSWDEGLELLLEFGNVNGHFNVPKPEFEGKVDIKSDALRLYNWVASVHGMYRQYKMGRQSGSLTDDRVLLLVKHGFVFRENVTAEQV